MSPVASLILYRFGGVSFGIERPYQQGFVLPSDPQFNYEPMMLAAIVRNPTEAPTPRQFGEIESYISLQPHRPEKSGKPEHVTPEPGTDLLALVALVALVIFRRLS
jgi:hypothetical protein